MAEEGTHDELLARNGVYAELYRIQFERRQRRPAERRTCPPKLSHRTMSRSR